MRHRHHRSIGRAMNPDDPYGIARFEAALGTTSTIDTPVGRLSLQLERVTARPDGTGFSAMFLGPRQPVIAQATHTLHGGALDGLPLFLVPVQPTAPVDGTEYEAIITASPIATSTSTGTTTSSAGAATSAGSTPSVVAAPAADRARIALRRLDPADPADTAFDRSVYASTRAEEMAQLDWSPADIDAFIAQQHHAQTTHYRANYPGLEHSIITVDGTPAGRLLVHRTPDETRIVDIAILPAHRGHGIGRMLIEQVIADSGTTPVGIHVELTNPAQRLYARLGFVEHHTHGLYRYLRTDQPPPTAADSTTSAAAAPSANAAAVPAPADPTDASHPPSSETSTR